MKIRKAIKKIVALGTGLTMVGATILGASAANLSEYPSQFITDGAFDGVIVVGESAAASDVVGSVDIATNLQYSSSSTSAVGGTSATSVVIEGDAYRVDKSTNFLEIAETINSVITAKMTSSDIEALAKGSIVNSKGTFTYNQYLTLPDSAEVKFVSDPDDDDAVVQRYLKFTDNQQVYLYKIEFPTPVESDVDSSDDMDDFESKKITLLGTEYTITGSDNSTKTLELMGGAVEATMQEYETKKFTINGIDYEVEVVAIDSTPQVILKVNGDTTDKLIEGETYKLDDGTEVGIKTIIENEGTETGGGDIVTFFLGAKKLKLKDAAELEISGEKMDGTTVGWSSSFSGSDSLIKINYINVSFVAQDDYYVPEAGKLSEKIEELDALFGRAIDFEYAGEVLTEKETLKLTQKNKNELRMTFTQHGGAEVTLPVAYIGGGTLVWGDDTHDTWMHEVSTNASNVYQISKNDYFVVSKDKASTVLQYKGHTASTNQTKFKNTGTADSWEESLAVNTLGGNIKVGGEEFAYWIQSASSNDQNITVDLDGDGNIMDRESDTFVPVYTANEWNLTINATGNDINISVRTPDQTDTGNAIEQFYIDISNTGSNTAREFTDPDMHKLNASMASKDDDSDDKIGMSQWGALLEQSYDSTAMDSLTLTLPKDQTEEIVYVTSGVTKIVESGATGEVTSTTITPISVGAAVLDSEVSDITAVNAIVVGGPCANSAAAVLMGNPANCVEGFTEGKAIIKLYENGDKVALLVAGMTALDTRRAARALASGDYPIKGMEVEVSGTTLTDITVTSTTA